MSAYNNNNVLYTHNDNGMQSNLLNHHDIPRMDTKINLMVITNFYKTRHFIN